MFELSSVILNAIGDDATYNGTPCKAFIDLDVEVEDEGGVYIRRNLAHVDSKLFDPSRGDVISHNGTSYTVENVISDDDDMLMLGIRKQ